MPSTRILRADNGCEVSLAALLKSGERPPVWTVDERQLIRRSQLADVRPAGRRDVLLVRLASGREVEAVGEQRLLTIDGWIPIQQLAVDDRIATPRIIPAPRKPSPQMPDHKIVLLAHMIGDGSCVRRQPIRYASIDEANLQAVTAAATHFGITAVRDEYAAARVTTLRLPAPYRLTHGVRNPIAAWLDELGIFGLRSYEKFVPDAIFGLSNDQIALFIRHLWATDGSVRWDAKTRQGRIYYASTSRRLIDGLLLLLLRLGVHGRIKRVQKAGYRECWHLGIDGVENQTAFLEDIGVHGARGESAAQVLQELSWIESNTNVDTVPKEIWHRVRKTLEEKGITHRRFQTAMGSRYCGSTMWKYAPSRSRLLRAAWILHDTELAAVAGSDLFWDRITEIIGLSGQETYSVWVSDTHNYVAQGIPVHDETDPRARRLRPEYSWCPFSDG